MESNKFIDRFRSTTKSDLLSKLQPFGAVSCAEAVVAGDHNTPENIASGKNTGAITNKGPMDRVSIEKAIKELSDRTGIDTEIIKQYLSKQKDNIDESIAYQEYVRMRVEGITNGKY